MHSLPCVPASYTTAPLLTTQCNAASIWSCLCTFNHLCLAHPLVGTEAHLSTPDSERFQFQVHSSAAGLKLITFDADGTLYADGAHMEHDSKMISHIINLMRSNVHVAIVTAAGYPGQADKFEQRVAGLTATFRKLHLPQHIMDRSPCCLLHHPFSLSHGIRHTRTSAAQPRVQGSCPSRN